MVEKICANLMVKLSDIHTVTVEQHEWHLFLPTECDRSKRQNTILLVDFG